MDSIRHQIFQQLTCENTLLKNTVLYLHHWFHKDSLSSMEPFNSTKVLYCAKKLSLDYSNYAKKKLFFSERFFIYTEMVLLYGITVNLLN